jgi:hypothetical protein
LPLTRALLAGTAWCCIFAGNTASAAEPLVLDKSMHHLRRGATPEWSTFPSASAGASREIRFTLQQPSAQGTLRIRQQDVKQAWHVEFNGIRLGDLRVDENDMIVYFAVEAAALRDGENVLRIFQDERSVAADDIRVGEVELHFHPIDRVLSGSTIQIDVRDAESGRHVPARITIAAESGALQSVGATSNQQLAVRPGIVYTATGRARLGVPPGRYQLWAGRGFEYSLTTTTTEVAAGETKELALEIQREVATPGYVACDTHVHTFTHSRHGDATIEERMITLAGEGIELPVATDHNLHIDYESTARA